jgi:phthiocerol/phenolphthiocerol synthesis type-I polyketide synthase C
MNKKRIAITGYSFRLPGTAPRSFWTDLLEGKNLVSQVASDRWPQEAYRHPLKSHPGTSYTFAAGSIGNIAGFDAAFFGISPREAAQIDPQQRLLLELAWEAFENAGMRPSAARGSSCGVYIGISTPRLLAAVQRGPGRDRLVDRHRQHCQHRGQPHLLRVRPARAEHPVDTACSSSLVAFHLACRSILSGESSQALAGGVSLHMHPYGFIIFSKASMLSRRGICNVFDAAGDGYVRSEGAARCSCSRITTSALADGDRVLAVVANSAVNSDGRKSGLTVPSMQAQAALLKSAYDEAGIAAADIDYIEAHGTGTAVGDPIETHALGEALGRARGADAPLLIGSVKSNVGHLETAAGAAGLVKALHCLQHRTVPATIHLDTPNPNIRFDEWNLMVATEPTPLKPGGRWSSASTRSASGAPTRTSS